MIGFGFVKEWHTLVPLRLLLGIFKANFFPGAVCAMEGEISTPPRPVNSPALQELKEEDRLVLYR